MNTQTYEVDAVIQNCILIGTIAADLLPPRVVALRIHVPSIRLWRPLGFGQGSPNRLPTTLATLGRCDAALVRLRSGALPDEKSLAVIVSFRK